MSIIMRCASTCYVIPLALAVAALGQVAPATVPAAAPAKLKITVGRETTFLTDPPLRGDGTVDYVKAYDAALRQGVTAENNAFARILTVLGPKVASDKTRAATLEALGLKDLPLEGDYYQSFGDYLSAKGVAGDAQLPFFGQLDAVKGHAWAAEEHPELAAWLAQEEKHLDALVAATARERFYIPAISTSGSMIDIWLPALGALRDAGNGLAARVSLRVGAGNLDGAWKDSLAGHRLGWLLTQQGTLIEILVGYAIESLMVKADGAILASPKLTAAQAKACLAELQGLTLGGIGPCLDQSERLSALDAIMGIAGGRMSVDGIAAGTGQRLTPEQAARIDWDVILRAINVQYDGMVAAANKPTFAERAAAWKEVSDGIGQGRKDAGAGGQPSEKKLAAVLLAILTPSVDRADILHDRTAMMAELERVAFALAAFKAEKGDWPETLDALVPGYLAAVPKDRFTDQPLHYKPTADGFVVYSVGDDMEDNGGSDARDKKGHFDLVIRVGK